MVNKANPLFVERVSRFRLVRTRSLGYYLPHCRQGCSGSRVRRRSCSLDTRSRQPREYDGEDTPPSFDVHDVASSNSLARPGSLSEGSATNRDVNARVTARRIFSEMYRSILSQGHEEEEEKTSPTSRATTRLSGELGPAEKLRNSRSPTWLTSRCSASGIDE